MAAQATCLYDKTDKSWFYYIKKSDFNTAIAAKDSEIQNLKSRLNQSEMSAGKLYAENEFVDVKIVCNEKTFACHKAVQWQWIKEKKLG